MFRLPDSWLWDFWIAKDQGSYHLFFLYASRALHHPDRRHHRAAIGHAVSADLVSWERVEDALVHGDSGTFDETATWTGSVVQGPDGRWHMFYTGMRIAQDGASIQQIGVATSVDLRQWVKSDSNPVVVADPRWYETVGGVVPWRDEHWRDPWVFADPDGDGWHMLITARANTGLPADRGVVGHAWSSDLVHWEVKPPLSQPGAGFGQLEVFQVEQVDGRQVLIFNCLTSELVPGRLEPWHRGGIWMANAESVLGPFDLAGAVPLTDDSLYVGKLVQDPAGSWVLLAFHNTGPDGNFVGALSDPMPVRWDGDVLTLSGAVVGAGGNEVRRDH